MNKLYKRIDGRLQYHEAWCHDGTVIEHWGVVGERGETRQHRLGRNENEDAGVRRVLRSATEQGYLPIDFEDHAILLIEFVVEGRFGTTQELDKRHALQSRMDETLGWTGVGACDGGSIGSGTMEVCCLVVDFDVAKRIVEADLRGTEFANYSRIYREDEAS